MAHGGVLGALAETGVAILVAALFLTVWFRSQRHRDGPQAEMHDDDDASSS